MRVFFDASIWLAALGRPEGGAARLMGLAESGMLVPLSSVSILEEAGRNVGKVGSTPADLEALVLRVRPFLVAIAAANLEAWPEVIAKDRHVIAGASLGKADFLATFDRKHLNNPVTRGMVPFAIGDAGACLDWLRRVRPEKHG